MLDAEWQGRIADHGPATANELAAVFPELVEAYTPAGFELSIGGDSYARLNRHGLHIYLLGSLTPTGGDPDDPYTPIGVIERELYFGRRCAAHHEFRLPLQWQDRRVGTDMVRRSIELYDQLGLVHVDLDAEDVGRYVWAMCGFEFRVPGAHHRVITAAQKFADRLPLERPLDLAGVRFPWEIAMLEQPVLFRDVAEARGDYREEDELSSDEGDEEIAVGKAIMLRGFVPSWAGRLHLAPNSPGRRMFDLYTDPHA